MVSIITFYILYLLRSRKPSPETWKTNWRIDKTNYPNKSLSRTGIHAPVPPEPSIIKTEKSRTNSQSAVCRLSGAWNHDKGNAKFGIFSWRIRTGQILHLVATIIIELLGLMFFNWLQQLGNSTEFEEIEFLRFDKYLLQVNAPTSSKWALDSPRNSGRVLNRPFSARSLWMQKSDSLCKSEWSNSYCLFYSSSSREKCKKWPLWPWCDPF